MAQQEVTKLPNSWINIEWGEITALDGFRRGPFGGNLKKSCFVEEGYSVYEQYAPINDDCTSFRYFVDEEKYQELKSFHVNEGDFLISCSGTMGRITHVPIGSPNGVINQALLRIRLQGEFIFPDYFLKLFRSPLIQHSVLNKTVGGAIQNLAAVKELKTISLPIAPLLEQKRIVEKLDSLLAQVDTIQQRLNNLPDIIKRFRQSVLAAAVSGKLTEQWRDNSEYTTGVIKSVVFPKEWSFTTLGKAVNYGKCSKVGAGEIEDETWVLELEDIEKETSKILKRINFGERQTKSIKNTFTTGDVLYGKLRPYLNKIVIADDDGVCTTEIIPISSPSNILSEYLFYWLKSPFFYAYVDEITYGVNMPRLGTNDGKKAPFVVPPLEEQTEIVRLVEQYFALADTLEKNLANAKQRVDNLTQSILAKAFRGELVPQDPNDEPAEKLLERIKTARLEAEKLEKAAKKAAKASKAKKK
jgi:type I restriction enzyme S subunit